jgi:hypothetical protein
VVVFRRHGERHVRERHQVWGQEPCLRRQPAPRRPVVHRVSEAPKYRLGGRGCAAKRRVLAAPKGEPATGGDRVDKRGPLGHDRTPAGQLGGNGSPSFASALFFSANPRCWVGEAGFEPATTNTQSSCTTRLCDSPLEAPKI